MGTQQKELVKKQISVLLWLKSLDDFKGEGFENSTFNEKYEAFEDVEATDEFTSEEYYDCVDFWIKKRILVKDKITDELSISKKGKKLFALIDSKGGEEISVIIKKEASSKKPVELEKIFEWVEGHYNIIMSILGLCFQMLQIAITLVK